MPQTLRSSTVDSCYFVLGDRLGYCRVFSVFLLSLQVLVVSAHLAADGGLHASAPSLLVDYYFSFLLGLCQGLVVLCSFFFGLDPDLVLLRPLDLWGRGVLFQCFLPPQPDQLSLFIQLHLSGMGVLCPFPSYSQPPAECGILEQSPGPRAVSDTCPIVVAVTVQSVSHVRLFANSWTAVCQASLFFTVSWKFWSISLRRNGLQVFSLIIEAQSCLFMKDYLFHSFFRSLCFPSVQVGFPFLLPLRNLHVPADFCSPRLPMWFSFLHIVVRTQLAFMCSCNGAHKLFKLIKKW